MQQTATWGNILKHRATICNMTSNIQIQRICMFCGKEFTAHTTVTKYCGDVCAKKAYKARIKAMKVEDSNTETFQIKHFSNEKIKEIGSKDYLNIEESCLLLSVSRWTLWRMIKSGRIPALKIGRLIRIKRTDIDEFFNQGSVILDSLKKEPGLDIDISSCYNISEIQSIFGISQTTLQELVKRNSIEKIKVGKYVYIPKNEIEKYLGMPHMLNN